MKMTTTYLLSPRTSSSRRILYIIVRRISFVFALLYSFYCPAQCGGAASDGSSFSDIGNGPGIVAWTTPTNAKLSDNVRAVTTSTIAVGATVISHYLYVRSMNLNVPAGASICGLEVVVEHRKQGSNGELQDNSVELTSGNFVTSNYAKSVAWSDTDEVFVYGGPTDTWGHNWTASELNSNTFGVNLTAKMKSLSVSTASLTAEVDHIYVAVYHSSVLPVELTSFSAEAKEDNRVLLDWSTSTETNSNYFAIERSRDGKSYEKLTQVKGAGTTLQTMYYRYIDHSPLPGVSYYRLRQVDFNGSEKVYPGRSVYFTNRGGMSVATVPGTLYISLKSEGGAAVDIQIFNLQGATVHRSMAITNDKETIVRVNTSDFVPGIYFVKSSTGHSEFSDRIFIQRE